VVDVFNKPAMDFTSFGFIEILLLISALPRAKFARVL